MSQVADLVGVHRSTILRLLDAGKLGCYQIGDRRILAESHLQEFLLLAERKATVKSLPWRIGGNARFTRLSNGG